jgi:hypothetical protein
MADDLTSQGASTAGDAGSSANASAEGTATAAVNAGATSDTRTFTQAELDQIISARLAEHQKRSAAQLKAAADKSEQDRLTAQGEYKTLAEKAQARVAELEPLSERIAAYEATITGLLKVRLDGLPSEARKAVDALPGNPSPLDRLNWVEANAALFTRTAPPSINARDGQAGALPADPKEREAEIRRRFRIN